jgi:hypothetical protein
MKQIKLSTPRTVIFPVLRYRMQGRADGRRRIQQDDQTDYEARTPPCRAVHGLSMFLKVVEERRRHLPTDTSHSRDKRLVWRSSASTIIVATSRASGTRRITVVHSRAPSSNQRDKYDMVDREMQRYKVHSVMLLLTGERGAKLLRFNKRRRRKWPSTHNSPSPLLPTDPLLHLHLHHHSCASHALFCFSLSLSSSYSLHIASLLPLYIYN